MFKRFSVFAAFFALLPLVRVEAAELKTVYVRLCADSENAGYETYRAMDGNVRTMWHTQWSAEAHAHPCPHPIDCFYPYSCGYDHLNATIPSAHGFMPLPEGTERLPCYGVADGNKAANAVQLEFFGITRKPGNNVSTPHAVGIDLGGVYPLTGFSYTPCNDGTNGTTNGTYYYSAMNWHCVDC